ncbi:MAG: secretion system protein [Acidobacteria bacterium]|nr:MAG: secretion system protein [Acidobacteriota bacterium]PYV29035.1 MAG: secretion system protein [Acidobacteriota bacterium]
MFLMTIAALIFVVGFIVILLLLSARSPVSARLMAVTSQTQATQAEVSPMGQRQPVSLEQLANALGPVRKYLGFTKNPEITQRLAMAGYRKASHTDVFLLARMLLPVGAAVGAFIAVRQNVVVTVIILAVVGFMAPDFWLTRAIAKRKQTIKLSLPDALDLLVICLEAGLGLDQALLRVGQEMRSAHKELSEEFLLVNLEQRAGKVRVEAWRNMAQRTGVESVRAFVHMLAQTERFGTPISKSLGAFAEALRLRRRQQAEEMAAKTTIKLVPPLVMFIFPSLFIVLLAPAVLIIGRNLGKAIG